MRRIGIIGGMSAESTALYYAALNAAVRRQLGGLHSADLVLRSLDFAPIAALQAEGRWEEAGAILAAAARDLERAGAEMVLVSANTMHKVIGQVEAATRLSVLHIADATGEAITRAGLSRPGLIATAFTMEQPFYAERLRKRFGLDVVIPAADDRARVHAIIYDELCRGLVTEASRAEYVAVAARLVRGGADCVILGCTEVG
ncbi:MAG: amino acid racemase, partial [Methylobacteriaceae bacterium]|nr:amino acid racemase [Methylobacteriaceae bacterium]